jgi:hypothetical protein
MHAFPCFVALMDSKQAFCLEGEPALPHCLPQSASDYRRRLHFRFPGEGLRHMANTMPEGEGKSGSRNALKGTSSNFRSRTIYALKTQPAQSPKALAERQEGIICRFRPK